MVSVLGDMYKRYTLFGIGESRPYKLTSGASSLPLYGDHIHAEFPIVTFGWDRGSEGLTTIDRLTDRSHPAADPFSVVVYFTNPDIGLRNKEFKDALTVCMSNSNIMIQCELDEALPTIPPSYFDNAKFNASTSKFGGDTKLLSDKWYMACDVTAIRPMRSTPSRPEAYTLELTLDPETPWYRWCKYLPTIGSGTPAVVSFNPATENDAINEFTGGNEFILHMLAPTLSEKLSVQVTQQTNLVYSGEFNWLHSLTGQASWILTNVKGYEGMKVYETPKANPDELSLRTYYSRPQEVISYSTIRIDVSNLRVLVNGVNQATINGVKFELYAKSYRMGL